jgi:hypothetical protein
MDNSRFLKKPLYFLGFFLILIIASCGSSDGPQFNNVYSDAIIEYRINITDSWVTDYSRFIDDELDETTYNINHDTVVIRLMKNKDGDTTYIGIYQIGDQGLAISSTDTSYGEYGKWVTNSDFKYQGDFLIERDYKYWDLQAETIDSGNIVVSSVIENENIISQNTLPNNWQDGCTDYYTYNSELNIFDINNFSNGIFGRINKNLLQHVSLRNGCPCGPSMESPYISFEYLLDDNGYVKESISTNTPCYHLTYDTEVDRTIYTTKYKYIFN